MRIVRDVAASSITISVCGLVSQAAAFVTTFLLAKLFGAGPEVDAFTGMIAVPYFVVALVQASVNKAFLPVFIRERSSDRSAEAWRTAAGAGLGLAGMLAALGALGFLLRRPVIDGLFTFPPETRALAVRLAAVTFPAVLPLGLGTFLVSLHMARRRFLVASLSTALQTTGGLIALLALHARIGILALPVGLVAGSGLQVLLLGLPLARNAVRHGIARLADEAFSRFAGLVPLLLFAALFSKAFQLLEKSFGALLPPGSLSHMAYGWKVVAFLFFLVSNGVIHSSFTYLSETAAIGDRAELRRRTAAITRVLLLVLLPLVTAAFVLRVEAMSLFERGEFTRADSHRAALAVTCYLPLLVVFSLNGIASHVFYALGRVRTVALVSMGAIGLYVAMGPAMARAAGMPGLLVSYGVAVLAGYLAYLALLRPLIGGFEGRALLVTLVRGVVAAAVAGALLEGLRQLLEGTLRSTPFPVRVGLLAVLFASVCAPYAAVVRLLGDRELFDVLRALRRREKVEP